MSLSSNHALKEFCFEIIHNICSKHTVIFFFTSCDCIGCLENQTPVAFCFWVQSHSTNRVLVVYQCCSLQRLNRYLHRAMWSPRLPRVDTNSCLTTYIYIADTNLVNMTHHELGGMKYCCSLCSQLCKTFNNWRDLPIHHVTYCVAKMSTKHQNVRRTRGLYSVEYIMLTFWQQKDKTTIACVKD